MKLKGINPLEQNVDKIVVGVVSLALVAAVGAQFLASGNMVKVGTVTVPAVGAFDPVVKAAQSLNAKLDEENPARPEAPTFGLSDKLVIGAAAKPVPNPTRVALGTPPALGRIGTETMIATATYAPPVVPAPTVATARAFAGTISPVEQIRSPELAKMLPAEQPFDKSAVTIEARFSGLALKDSLLNDPDGEGPMEAMPLSWWRDPFSQGLDLVEVIAVEVERETLRAADGGTPQGAAATVILPAIPGRADMLKAWNESVKSIGDMAPVVETARFAAQDVQRPKYYEMIAGPEWKPPSEFEVAADDAGKERNVKRLRTQLEEVDEKFATAQQKLDQTPAPRGQEPTRATGGARRGGSGGDSRDPAPTETGPSRQSLERQIATLKTTRARIVKQLQALGEVVEEVVEGGVPAEAPPALGLLENPEVQVWAHDLNAQPGAQYRYRVRIVVNNPLFGHNLQESQKELSEASLLRGEWSDWTLPVDVDRHDYFFITSAQEPGIINPRPTAVASIFRLYYGFYREATVPLEPGDMLVGEAKVPELKLADMKRLAAILAGDEPGQVIGAAPTPPPAGPEGGPGRRPIGGHDDRGTPVAAAPVASVPAGAEWMSLPGPRELQMLVDAVFLDVARVATASAGLLPGGDRERFQAVLRDQSGSVLIRMPDSDRNRPEFRRVDASAKAGLTQGQPVAKPVEKANPNQQRPDRRDGPPEPPRGKGGGGGGGGG